MKKEIIEVKQIDWFDSHWYRIRYLNEEKAEIEEYFASVTTKLGVLAKPHLLRWYGEIGYQEARRKTREAADRGTRIHWAWYIYVNNGAIIYNNPQTPAYTREEIEEIYKKFKGNVWILEDQLEHWDFLKLVEMFKRLDPQIVESEKKVFNIEHHEAGTADNLFNIKEGKYEISGATPLSLPGGMYVGDLKTGAAISNENLMQISAYVYCAESMGYDTFQGALIYHTQGKSKKGIEGLSVTHLTRDEIAQHYADYRDVSRVWERQAKGSKPIIRQLPCLVTRDKEWTQSKDSSEIKANEQTEKPSTQQSEKPKPGASKQETGASSKTSDSSSTSQVSTEKDTTKTSSKKES